jgi:subtilisin family serine protease
VAPESDKEIPDGDIVLGGNPTTFSACESDELYDKDLKGKLALVHEGPCTISEQAGRVATAGAIGLVYFNSKENDPVRAPYRNTTIPVATISAVSGHHLISILKNVDDNKDTVHMHFERNAFIFKSATGDTIADFSSMGPTNELDMKPSFAAIGGNVYSTLPEYLGGWGTKSGTSMSAPYIAGTVALLREAFAGQNILSSTIHEKLQNYGKPLNTFKHENNLESPLRQGSGIIQGNTEINKEV